MRILCHTLDQKRSRCLTFDLEADLVLLLSQEVAHHTGVGALVLWTHVLDLQRAVHIHSVVPSIQTTALPVLKPAHTVGC